MPAITMICSSVSWGNRCTSNRKNNPLQIRAAGEDLLRAGRQLALRPHRQGEQVEQGIKIRLLAQLLQADPVHLAQEHL